MKQLLLYRHAKSSWDDGGVVDRDRRLSSRGRRDADLMAEAIAARGLLPDRILCSPAERTRETLAALQPHLDAGTAIDFVEDLYSGADEHYAAAIAEGGDGAARLMVIGHNPRIQATALALVGAGKKAERAALATKFPTGAVAVIAFNSEDWRKAGPGRLEAFLRPRDLAAADDAD